MKDLLCQEAEHSNRTLASSITREASKQTYYTIRFLVDRNRVLDAYRAYSYFRWVDDRLDQCVMETVERIAFVERQTTLIDRCYMGDSRGVVTAEEELLVELIQGDIEKNSGLQSYIRNMMAVMAFDAERKRRLISQQELTEYTYCLSTAVTEALHHFIGHQCKSPQDCTRNLAVTAAHITHMLRDTLEDTQNGYFNIPSEYLAANGIDPQDIWSDPYRRWVQIRVEQARSCFKIGMHYLARVENPRCRLAGYAYITRFTGVLDAIVLDGIPAAIGISQISRNWTRIKEYAWLFSLLLIEVTTSRTGHAPGRQNDFEAMKTASAIVIGAGIGGIVAAAHLARRGVRVTVLEKNSRPGGRCDRFSRDGHTFDSGPTLLVMPLLYEAEFAALGESMRDMLGLQRVDPTYHLVFDDGSQLSLTSDMANLYAQLETIEPGSYAGFLRYVEEGQRHYGLAIDRLVNRDFRKASEFFTLENLPLILQLKPLIHHYRNMSAYFKEPRLKAAFTFQDVYMGLSPFEAPATFSMMPYTELAHGVWYPRGGMYRVVEAVMEIAIQAGVEFAFDTKVERIELNGSRARGVTLANGSLLEADAILANADLPYVYLELLPPSKLAENLIHKRFSCSVISFFWGVDKPYPMLGPHTLFLADDYRQNFESIIHDLTLPDNPSLYIHAPARLEASMSPPGEDTLIAIVPVGHLDANGEQDWGELRDRARQDVFRRLATLGILDLEAHLKFEVSYNPLSWQKRYNLLKGSTHGLCHNLTQLGYFRPRNRHPKYHNLYFAGASTHPGTGIPSAFVSARLAAERMVEDLGIRSPK